MRLKNIAIVILILLSVSMLITTLWQSYWNSEIDRWATASAEIRDIQVKRKSAEIIYSYSYEGESFRGNRLSFLSEGTILDKNLITSNYKVGQTVEVFVNQEKPSMSVLFKRKYSFKYFKNYLVVMFLSLIVALVLWKFGDKSNTLKESGRADLELEK